MSEHEVVDALSEARRKELAIWKADLASVSEKVLPLRDQVAKLGSPDQAWASLALSLINLKEFIYLK